MHAKLTAADVDHLWSVVAARMIENRRLSVEAVFLETLDEIARLKAKTSAGFSFDVSGITWTAKPGPDGGLDLEGQLREGVR